VRCGPGGGVRGRLRLRLRLQSWRPVIGITTLVGLPWVQERVGNPENPAYVPGAQLPFTSQMSLWQRTLTPGQLYAVWGRSCAGADSTTSCCASTWAQICLPSANSSSATPASSWSTATSASTARDRCAAANVEVGGMNVDPNPEPLPEPFGRSDGAARGGARAGELRVAGAREKLPAKQLQAFLKVLGRCRSASS
ncbi:Protein of unknown function, partial [Gryllus bimaculatus]